MRITVDGIAKEKSTKRKWEIGRWDQKLGRPTGTKEDARSLQAFLDTLELKVANARTELIQKDITVTAHRFMDIVEGKLMSKTKVLEEYQLHNDEVAALTGKGEFSPSTLQRHIRLGLTLSSLCKKSTMWKI